MNFATMKTRIARRTGKNATTLDSTTGGRLADFLNEAQKELLSEPGMHTLRYGRITFDSVAGTQQYALPVQGIARVDQITESTNRRKLAAKTLDWLRATDPSPQQSTPWAWVPIGYQEVHTQPSDASTVAVKSTSAADTASCFIEGIISGGYTRSETITMTGTTAALSQGAGYIQITKFYIGSAAVGNVTLHEDTGAGTELAKIILGDTRAQFYSLLLYDTPSAAITYTCDVTRSVPDMQNDNDEPLIPEDFHDLLVDMATWKELLKGDDPGRMANLERHILKRKRDLKSWVNNHPDWQPVAAPNQGISRLGAWYPADTWP